MTRGQNTAWEVRTSPPGAAVRTSNGLACDSTPCSLEVSRKARFTATVSKPGYEPVDIAVSHTISTEGGLAFAGNVLIGGLIGATVDVITGAYNDLTPNNVELKLERNGFLPSAGAGAHFSLNDRGWAPTTAPALQQGSSYQGRVTTLRVLPDGSVQEMREQAN